MTVRRVLLWLVSAAAVVEAVAIAYTVLAPQEDELLVLGGVPED